LQLDLSIFNPKARPLLGLDISTSSVKMVELSDAGKEGYRVERFSTETLPRDAVVEGNIVKLEAVAEAVKKAWKRLGTPTRYVAMALPASNVITKKINVAAGQRESDLEALVESEATQYIPFSLDEVNLDFQVVGPAPNNPNDVEVLIAASRKEKVEDRIAVAEAAGLEPLVMDVESYAAQAAFELVEQRLPEGGKDQVIALFDIGANLTNLTIFRNDQHLYSRDQPFGGYQLTQEIMRHYGMSPDDAESAKRDNKLPENYENDLLRPFMDTLALECSRALQFFFTSTAYSQVDHIILSGGSATIPGLDEVVAARTLVSSRVANPFLDMQLSQRVKPHTLAAAAPSLMVACGLALRRFDK
jgi:type IV pilus assembly protein PilM